MSEASLSLLAGLTVAGITVAVVLGLGALLSLIARLVVGARDELRDRYGISSWRPQLVDLLGVPAWVALELACLIGGLLLVILTIWATYSAARSFRDWWHCSEREH